jgi:outer membrane lipoprotein-sorting protein
MRKTIRFRGALVLVLTVLLSAVSALALAAEFSADMVHKMGTMSREGKVYVKGKKMRTESGMGQGITIVDGDTGTVWVLQPAQKMYFEMKKGATQPTQTTQSDEELAKLADKKLLGTETVNGYQCEKYLYTYHDKALGTMTMWIATKLGQAIKMVHQSPEGESSFEYRNIKEGGVADSLFQIPAGYTKMQMPGMPGMGKGMGKGMGPGAGGAAGTPKKY